MADLNSICSKLNRRILPLIIVMFFLSLLDRTNLSFVKGHIEASAGIGAAAYALGAGIFFIGYAAFEIPSNLYLHRFGARIWLSRIMITWGLVTAAMIFIRDETSFYILRFLLGLAEAGFSPGVILYLSYFYPPSHRSRAYGFYQQGAPLAFVFGSIISTAILDYFPPVYFANWQWMFLIEGALTVLVGIFALFYLDDKPSSCKWLSQEEKSLLIANLEEHEAPSELPLAKTFANITVWKFVFVYFCIQLSVYGVLFYLPTKISQFLGTSVGLKVGLLTAAVWVSVFVGLPLLTGLADRAKAWRKYAIALLLLATLSMVAAALSPNLALFIVCMAFAAIGFICIQPIFWNLPTQFLKGKSAAAGIALIGALGNLGGFVAPNLKNWAEVSTGASYAGLMALAGVAIWGVLTLLALKEADKK